ncbi:MAG: hypothetical protein P8R42_06300 [Candidatus Binatia bacterium]|nr:hypothetical protein [Candidatus Binatia bacterium]
MSSLATGSEIELGGVNEGEGEGDAGISHGARLLAFTDAVMRGKDAELERERKALNDEEYVDAVATVGAFNVVDRIADSTGIPLDATLEAVSKDVRDELGLARFGSSANTPGARV